MSDVITDTVCAIVARVARIATAEIGPQTLLEEELKLRSMHRLEIGCELEDHYQLPFDAVDEATETGWVTVADVIATAQRLMAQQAAAGGPAMQMAPWLPRGA